MAIDELIQITRAERRARRAPPGRQCDDCVASGMPLVSRGRAALCYTCLRRRNGAGPYEADHIAGRTYLGAITLQLHPNDHRTLTELREVLGMSAWPSPDSSLDAALAHFLANLGLVLWLVATWWLDSIAGGGGASMSPAVPT